MTRHIRAIESIFTETAKCHELIEAYYDRLDVLARQYQTELEQLTEETCDEAQSDYAEDVICQPMSAADRQKRTEILVERLLRK